LWRPIGYGPPSALRSQRLADYPNLGRPGRVDETRELVVADTPYIVAYVVLDNQLMILSVLHGAREWPKRF
jgi:toxin ParE1/3/4